MLCLLATKLVVSRRTGQNAHPEAYFADHALPGKNSLFLGKFSLFRRKNSLFDRTGNSAINN
jgi:hypothetical protein